MIQKIDIANFGVYKNCVWKSHVGNDTQDLLKRLNIIYGRNYSGKTTLSRIFKSLEDKSVNSHYLNPSFEITLSDESKITPASLPTYGNPMLVRVYNSDFVRENLSWLHNSDGSINPFTILGAKNIEIENEIAKIDAELGSVIDGKGLVFEYNESKKKLEEARQGISLKKKELDDSLKDKALEIKNNAALYHFPTYIITTIKKDIGQLTNSSILSSDKIDELKKMLKDEKKESITVLNEIRSKYKEYSDSAQSLVEKQITPNKAIEELIIDNVLQAWVEKGLEYHKQKREKCAFCGGDLTSKLWDELDAHFNKESKDLKEAIEAQIKLLEKVETFTASFSIVKKEQFYSIYHEDLEKLLTKWELEKTEYSSNIKRLIATLKQRQDDIFTPCKMPELFDNSIEMQKVFRDINAIIAKNNDKTITLTEDQTKYREQLRLSEVATFIRDIKHKERDEEVKNEETALASTESDLKLKEARIGELNKQKEALVAQAQDESRGAELVNKHLQQFFGHDQLKLQSEGKAPNAKFKVLRDNKQANNLSEGECSLISFCYFIAKIEDEMNDTANNQKLIIYIDDPISSLDNNHIFFLFSLIETVIAKPKKYGQLFISTHNLDFLKYLKKITSPDRNDVNYFQIERLQKKSEIASFIRKMPPHIRDYVTEFNYLFKQLYEVYKEVNYDKKQKIENTYNQFYNLPNNLRKFLECYLFYKYPNNNSPLTNLDKLFDGHIPSLINRIINEYSHLTYLDRGWRPIDVDEAENCVKTVLDKIKEKDEDQFNALIDSLSI